MWKSTVGHTISSSNSLAKQILLENINDPDDWDTDPDFVNNISEKDQRWGSKTIEGSGRLGSINIEKLRADVKNDDSAQKKREYEVSSKPSAGYGGKFGIQQDRVDVSAHGFAYVQSTTKHSSQTDYSRGFGGKYGVQSSQQDKSAVGFDHIEKLSKHSSQTDYSRGFGGKYGVNSDRKDKSALGFDHIETVPKHSSQTDYSKGFGGKYGVENNKQDKCASGFNEEPEVVGTNYQRTRVESKADIKGLKNRFENANNDQMKKKAEELKLERMNKDKLDKEKEQKRVIEKTPEKSPAKANEPTFQAPLKSVTSSPFKMQEQAKPANFSSINSYQKPHSTGKIKINPQFLQNSSTTSSSQFKSPNKFSELDNNSSAATSSVVQPQSLPIQAQQQPPTQLYNEPAPPVQSYQEPTPPVQSYQIQPPAVQSYQVPQPYHAPTPMTQSVQAPTQAKQTFNIAQPPAFLKQQNKSDDDDDEWGNSDEPIQIMPTIAPLATYDEHEDHSSVLRMQKGSTSAPNNDNHNQFYSENQDFYKEETTSERYNEEPCQGGEQFFAQNNDQNNNQFNGQKTSLTAIALYDYQANDVDEISFDPNDTITDIVQVDEGWWQGKCKGCFGLFPANYVQLI